MKKHLQILIAEGKWPRVTKALSPKPEIDISFRKFSEFKEALGPLDVFESWSLCFPFALVIFDIIHIICTLAGWDSRSNTSWYSSAEDATRIRSFGGSLGNGDQMSLHCLGVSISFSGWTCKASIRRFLRPHLEYFR